MRRSRWVAVALAAVTAMSGGLLVAATGTARAATTVPPWEPDPNSEGSISFYSTTGALITGGSNLNHLFDYAAASSGTSDGAEKATLEFSNPAPGTPTGDFFTGSASASTFFPNDAAPNPISGTASKNSSGKAFTNPLVTLQAADANLTAFIASATPNTASGYVNMYQVRLVDSESAGGYWDTDIEVNPSAGTWTQVYPTPPATTPTYTWIGTGSKNSADHSWSDAANWQGGKAPAANSTDNLVFPVLTCTSGAKCGNVSTNNISGLTVKSLTIDLSGAATQPQPGTYDITGTAIKIGGLTVSTPTTLAKGKLGQSAQLLTPMTLTGNETWAVVLGPSAKFSVAGVSGTGTLGIGLKPVTIGGGQLAFTAAVNTGAVTITGPSSGSVTSTALPASAINSNGKTVTLTDTALTAANSGTTTLGPLTVTKSAVTIGAKGGAGPYGILKTDGKAALTSTSTLSFQGLEKPSGAPVAGTNYPQLSATGPVTLASAKLALFAGCTNPVGTTYTIVKTTGAITGTFAGLANGAKVQATKDTQASCTKSGATAPYFTITYTATAVTAKVVAAPAVPAVGKLASVRSALG